MGGSESPARTEEAKGKCRCSNESPLQGERRTGENQVFQRVSISKKCLLFVLKTLSSILLAVEKTHLKGHSSS